MRGDGLQLRNDLVPDRHEEARVGDRQREDQARPQSEQRDSGTLECHHCTCLCEQIDLERAPAKPDEQPCTEPRQSRPPAFGGQRNKLVALDPDEPGNDRRNQQNVAVSVDVPPLVGHLRPLLEGHDKQQEPDQPDLPQATAPCPCRRSIQSDFRRHLALPSLERVFEEAARRRFPNSWSRPQTGALPRPCRVPPLHRSQAGRSARPTDRDRA